MASIVFTSSGFSVKSPSRFALMREGVLDLGITERECAMPHAVVSKLVSCERVWVIKDLGDRTYQEQFERRFCCIFCRSSGI